MPRPRSYAGYEVGPEVAGGKFLELKAGDILAFEFTGYGEYQKYRAKEGTMEDRPEVVNLETGEVGVLRAWAALMSRLKAAKASKGDKFLLEVSPDEKIGKGRRRKQGDFIRLKLSRLIGKNGRR